MNKKTISLVIVVSLIMSMFATTSATIYASTTSSNIKYIDASGKEQTCQSATIVTSETTTFTEQNGTNGWYVVNNIEPIVIDHTVTVSGNVNIILTDGCNLIIYGKEYDAAISIKGEDNSLSVFGQTLSTGSLKADGGTKNGGPGIGTNNFPSTAENITINGGNITAIGNTNCAGIGGGKGCCANNIVINGGIVNAYAGGSAAGIGGGGMATTMSKSYCGNATNIIINGGSVNAYGGSFGAGIGGGDFGHAEHIEINGGNVLASCDEYASSIGGSIYNLYGSSSDIKVYKDSVIKADLKTTPTTRIVNDGKDLTNKFVATTHASITPGYKVSITESDEGRLTTAFERYEKGDEVFVASETNYGYVLDSRYLDGTLLDGDTFTMPEKDVVISASYNKIPEPVLDATYSAFLSLGKNIDIYFSMKELKSGFDKDSLVVSANGEYVNISYDKSNNKISGVLKSVSPIEMSTTIQVKISYNGIVVKEFSYGVRDYCEAVFEAAKTQPEKYKELATLCEGLLNYGKWAEDYYNETYKKSTNPSLVNKDHEIDFTNYEISGVKSAVSNLAGVKTGEAFLTLDSTIGLNFVITGSEYELNLAKQNFFILNDQAKPKQIDPTKITLSGSDGNYVVSVDLFASQLPTSYTLKIKGVETSEFCLTYGVYNYCEDIQDQSGSSNTLKTLCKAINCYGQAVQTYINR